MYGGSRVVTGSLNTAQLVLVLALAATLAQALHTLTYPYTPPYRPACCRARWRRRSLTPLTSPYNPLQAGLLPRAMATSFVLYSEFIGSATADIADQWSRIQEAHAHAHGPCTASCTCPLTPLMVDTAHHTP